MKLVLVGGTGGSGLAVLWRAVADGHTVTALVRSPDKIPEDLKPKITVVKADIMNSESMVEGMRGADAVISTLGVPGAAYRTITLYSESMKSIVGAMEAAGVRRLVAMTSWCTKKEPGNPAFIEWFLKPMVIGRHCADMALMEDFLRTKKDTIDFTTVRPGGLTDGPATDKDIKVLVEAQWVESSSGQREGAQIARADVARFLLSAVQRQDLFHHAVAIGWN